VPLVGAAAYREGMDDDVDAHPPVDGGVTDDPSIGTDSRHADERPIDKFRKTAVGSVVAAGLLGLRDVLEGRPEREEIAIVNDAPTPPTAGPTLVFDDETGTVTVTLPPRDSSGAPDDPE
jgi:hypothetical protein